MTIKENHRLPAQRAGRRRRLRDGGGRGGRRGLRGPLISRLPTIEWGNAVPAPNGYFPERSIRGKDLGYGDFNAAADLFYYEEGQELYVADSGNNRIVVMTVDYEPVAVLETLDNNGEEVTLSNPTGVFVRKDTVYIADQGNARVIICDKTGKIRAIYGKPESVLLDEGLDYKPSKVVVDDFRKIYVQAVGSYQGSDLPQRGRVPS